jgi:predicted TIM-barrel fold metal-dependent hydrolase
VTERLQAAIATMPVDDAHCHPMGERDAQTTPDDFIERIALSAFPGPAYFPQGVYDRWHAGDAATRAELDRRYGVGKTLAFINRHFESSVFVKYMLKEMAGFLGCKPTLGEVIEARNARGKDYFGYIHDLFRDARIENAMLDTGYADGLDAAGIRRFAKAVAPTKVRYIARVETLLEELLEQDLSYPELRDRYVAKVRDALDGTGNFGERSYGMKSYLLPDIGVIKPVYEDDGAAASWEEFKKTSGRQYADREDANRRGKVLRERFLTLALEECLARDMPMQFHAGDGEAPSVTLRNQQPYYLEEIARFDKGGVMRMPKIIPIHAGYPLVSEAAWLSHLYANVYFETSLMTPFIHQGLLHRYLEIMEAVPLSKILFGSDAYNVPELYWLAARWGKRYLARALTVYVREGVLDETEALEGARMMLHRNTRQTYNLRD